MAGLIAKEIAAIQVQLDKLPPVDRKTQVPEQPKSLDELLQESIRAKATSETDLLQAQAAKGQAKQEADGQRLLEAALKKATTAVDKSNNQPLIDAVHEFANKFLDLGQRSAATIRDIKDSQDARFHAIEAELEKARNRFNSTLNNSLN